MAGRDDKSLIGFDPLAWMDDATSDEAEAKEESFVVEEAEQETADSEENMSEAMVDKTPDESTSDSGLTLDATHNIQNVSHLYERLLTLLESQDSIEIDASEVVTIDTSTLQLLVVLKQEAIKLQKEMLIDFPSDKFIEAAELLGLAEMLNVDQVESGFF